MKILTVVPLGPGPRGGIEDYAFSVLQASRERGEVVVVAPSIEGERMPHGPQWDGIEFRFVPAHSLFQRRWPSTLKARSQLRKLARTADVIHVHMPAPRLEVWAADVARVAALPLVVTYHMDAIYDGGRLDARPGLFGAILERAYDRILARRALEVARIIVVNSRGYARESRLLPMFLPKVRVIRQGVAEAHTTSSDGGAGMRRRLISEGQRLVTFLGRLVPYKGVHYLVEAASWFKSEDVVFAIAGRGPLQSRLHDLAKSLGREQNFRFLGFVPDHEVADLLHASDVVVCPSISLAESTPIVLLESLACGTPVVGTRLGGTEESIPDDGVSGKLVRPRDVGGLASAIRGILDSNPWKPWRSPAYTRTWRDVASDYWRLYDEVAS